MAKKPASIENLNYEQALAELEEIISNLESEPSGLERSVAMFERGKALILQCQKLLESAEMKVQKLEEDGSTSPLEE
jgi:exodeoxyribonuclease VII small subunit